MRDSIIEDILDEYKRLKCISTVSEDYERLMNRLEDGLKMSKPILNEHIQRTPALELERVFLAKGCSSLVSFIEGARYVEQKLGL